MREDNILPYNNVCANNTESGFKSKVIFKPFPEGRVDFCEAKRRDERPVLRYISYKFVYHSFAFIKLHSGIVCVLDFVCISLIPSPRADALGATLPSGKG